MKSNKEMTDAVFARMDAYEQKRTVMRARMRMAAGAAGCLVLLLAGGLFLKNRNARQMLFRPLPAGGAPVRYRGDFQLRTQTFQQVINMTGTHVADADDSQANFFHNEPPVFYFIFQMRSSSSSRLMDSSTVRPGASSVPFARASRYSSRHSPLSRMASAKSRPT